MNQYELIVHTKIGRVLHCTDNTTLAEFGRDILPTIKTNSGYLSIPTSEKDVAIIPANSIEYVHLKKK